MATKTRASKNDHITTLELKRFVNEKKVRPKQNIAEYKPLYLPGIGVFIDRPMYTITDRHVFLFMLNPCE